MNKAFKKKWANEFLSLYDVLSAGKWQQNGIKNSEVSKKFFSDCGEVVKISDANSDEWVKLNPVGIPEQLIKSYQINKDRDGTL